MCARIRQIRLEVAGPRGKASFAKDLGLSPSTYDYYESSRIPPADVLVRIAEVAGVDLTWLLTGRSGSTSVPVSHPAVQRAAALLTEHPNAAAALRAFLDVLTASLSFPRKDEQPRAEAAATKPPLPEAPAAAAGQPLASTAAATPAQPVAPRAAEGPIAHAPGAPVEGDPKAEWIPILGRSAAGVPQFWSDQDASVGVTTLEDLVQRHGGRHGQSVAGSMSAGREGGHEQSVQVIMLRGEKDQEVVEFLAAAGVKARYPDAFAVRIDGESMSPFIRHGDLVVVSPSAGAQNGQAAVVQLDRQIGVTCKLYRRTGRTVHLVPINEQFPPQAVPADKVRWAFRVVARVRSQAPRPGA